MPRRQPLVLCIGNNLGRSEHTTLLERHGYQVMAISSGREGFSALRKNAVDAIILHPDVPAMGGAIVRRMKDIKPHIPIVLVCIRPAACPAADAIVAKHDPPARLLEILDNLLNVRFPFFTRWLGNWAHRESA